MILITKLLLVSYHLLGTIGHMAYISPKFVKIYITKLPQASDDCPKQNDTAFCFFREFSFRVRVQINVCSGSLKLSIILYILNLETYINQRE